MNEKYLTALKERNIKVIPLEEYKKDKIKILHKCICGNEWMVEPNRVKKGSQCGCKRKGSKAGKPVLFEEYLRRLEKNNISVKPIDNYIDMSTKILHKCICGNEWKIEPGVVLRNVKCGCVKYKIWSNEKYLEKLKENNINVIPLEKYKGSNVKILHKCICGNEWKIEPSLVLRNVKCECQQGLHDEHFYKNKKTILYYIKVNDIFKIGVTLFKNDIEYSIYKKRFLQDIKNGVNIKILKTLVFEDGSKAYLKEQNILKEVNEYKYKGNKILFGGNTELFTKGYHLV